MLIIVEGADGVGKTTFAHKLAAELNCDVWHKGPPTADPITEYEMPLVDYTPEQNVVCDRWHLGEVVYPPILGRGPGMDRETRDRIDVFLSSLGAYVVMLLNTPATIRRNVRFDDLVTAEQAITAQRSFMRVVQQSEYVPIHVISGYPTRHDVKRVIEAAQCRP